GLDARLLEHGLAHRLGLRAEAFADVVLAAERLTISIPTTASSAASVTSPLRSCTCRESGFTRRAKRSASTVIGGIETAVYNARRASTMTRTIPAPTIIIRLWRPCPRPQPMA